LVTLDTTRPDHLGAYGALRAATPEFDRVAADGVLFDRAWTVAPLTTPAHASVMTGLYPPAHGVRDNGRFRVSEAATTLAEAFAAAGYRTGGFAGAVPVARAFGFAQGFSAFDDDFGDDERGLARSERTASEVNARALPWLAAAVAAKAPFFAWIHYYDAHAPYEPPSPFAERFAGRPYDGEIAFVDAQLGRVLETLRSAGVLDRTVVAVVGDHGEGLGDHGEATHGLLVYEAMIHVPLAIRAPWAIARGVRRHDLASLVDVAPTLSALAKVPFPNDVDGRDLLAGSSSAAGLDDPFAPGPGRAIYAESYFAAEEFSWAPIVSIRRGDMKWITSPRPERYDLETDPGEAENLAGREAPRDVAMSALLQRVAAAATARHLDGATTGHVDEDLLSRLQSLGYVGGGGTGGPAPGVAAGGRDPKDGVRDYNDYELGTNLIDAGGDAVPLFERLVAADPVNPQFRLRLGQAYRARGDTKAAEGAYQELLHLYPDFHLAYRRLGALLAAQGRNAECRDLWLGLRARGADYVGVDARLAESYLATGENERALATAERGLAASGFDAELSVLAGRALERLERAGEALERYRNALSARPSDTEALDSAIALLRRLGRVGEIRPLIESCVTRSAGNAAVRQRLARLRDAAEPPS
jgi:arylsulfatase A-like enzyme/Flp pilus assembly protein TadD